VSPFFLNVALAMLWTFLSRTPSFTVFLVGFGLGFVLVVMGRRLFPKSNYVGRVLAFGAFVLAFLREFLVSNLGLIRVVLFRSRDLIHPGFLTYDVSGLTLMETQILTHCLTLTPGTTMVDVLDEGRTLLLHALDVDAPDALRRDIDEKLRDPLLRWTRS
jgi:multisubunit Na+/H+ antiporter MnhE subunit